MAEDFGMTLKELQAEVFDKGVETPPRRRMRKRTTCRRTAPRALRQQAQEAMVEIEEAERKRSPEADLWHHQGHQRSGGSLGGGKSDPRQGERAPRGMGGLRREGQDIVLP